MMKYFEHRCPDRRLHVVIHDENNRLVARAKPMTQGGYLITGYGLDFLDSRSLESNIAGKVDRRYMKIKTSREVRSFMKALAA